MATKTLAQMQSECDHGAWSNGGQVAVPAVKSGKVVLLNTLFCKKCGVLVYAVEEVQLPDSVTGSGILPVTIAGKN